MAKAKKTIRAKAPKGNENPLQVPVAMTDATKMMLSISNLGMRVQDVEKAIHNTASNQGELVEKVLALEQLVTQLASSVQELEDWKARSVAASSDESPSALELDTLSTN